VGMFEDGAIRHTCFVHSLFWADVQWNHQFLALKNTGQSHLGFRLHHDPWACSFLCSIVLSICMIVDKLHCSRILPGICHSYTL
jgi:hypothetical protein